MALFSRILEERDRGGEEARGPLDRLSLRRLAVQSNTGSQRKGTQVMTPVPGPAQPQAAGDLDALYGQASDYLRRVLEAVRAGDGFDIESGFQIMRALVESGYKSDKLFIKSIHGGEHYDFLIDHSVNVAIYSAKMGEVLGFSPDRQIEIAMLGLMHDIGIARIPEAIIYKKGALTSAERQYFRDRPRYSYEILSQSEADYAYLAECALAIYERIDGSGYPNSLSGEEIHEYAQIVGLMDIYEALIHARPQRERFPHYFAVKEIMRASKAKFRRDHLKALLNIFSVFPLDTYVRLNSGAIGQVVATYPDLPMRPKVNILYDGNHRKVLTGRVVDLPSDSLLYIVDAVVEEELFDIAEKAETFNRSGFAHHPAPEMEPASDETEGGGEEEPVGRAHPVRMDAAETAPGQTSRRRWWGLAALTACLLVALSFWFRSPLAPPPPAQRLAVSSPPALHGRVPPDTTAVGDESAADSIDENIGREDPVAEVAVSSPPAPSRVPVQAVPDGLADSRSLPAQSDSPAGPVNDPEPIAAVQEMRTTAPDGVAMRQYPYSVRVGYFKNLDEARQGVNHFQGLGIDPYWVKVDLETRGIWYRVFAGHFDSSATARDFIADKDLQGAAVKQTDFANRIGRYPDRQEALKERELVARQGHSPYLVERENGNVDLYVGAFQDIDNARKQKLELAANGIRSEVVHR